MVHVSCGNIARIYSCIQIISFFDPNWDHIYKSDGNWSPMLANKVPQATRRLLGSNLDTPWKGGLGAT